MTRLRATAAPLPTASYATASVGLLIRVNFYPAPVFHDRDARKTRVRNYPATRVPP